MKIATMSANSKLILRLELFNAVLFAVICLWAVTHRQTWKTIDLGFMATAVLVSTIPALKLAIGERINRNRRQSGKVLAELRTDRGSSPKLWPVRVAASVLCVAYLAGLYVVGDLPSFVPIVVFVVAAWIAFVLLVGRSLNSPYFEIREGGIFVSRQGFWNWESLKSYRWMNNADSSTLVVKTRLYDWDIGTSVPQSDIANVDQVINQRLAGDAKSEVMSGRIYNDALPKSPKPIGGQSSTAVMRRN